MKESPIIKGAPGFRPYEKRALFALIDAIAQGQDRVAEGVAMRPAAAVSGFYFSHSESTYFAVGQLGKDQVEDYAKRKGMDLKTTERWLASNLAYDPD